jgi:hypothetical protein
LDEKGQYVNWTNETFDYLGQKLFESIERRDNTNIDDKLAKRFTAWYVDYSTRLRGIIKVWNNYYKLQEVSTKTQTHKTSGDVPEQQFRRIPEIIEEMIICLIKTKEENNKSSLDEGVDTKKTTSVLGFADNMTSTSRHKLGKRVTECGTNIKKRSPSPKKQKNLSMACPFGRQEMASVSPLKKKGIPEKKPFKTKSGFIDMQVSRPSEINFNTQPNEITKTGEMTLDQNSSNTTKRTKLENSSFVNFDNVDTDHYEMDTS